MEKRTLFAILCITYFSFCTLYTPQPLLPLLVSELGISANDATLFITVTLVPLAIAPIIYGYFLQAIPARTVLFFAVALLAINQLLFLFATHLWQFLVLRFLQGCLLPGIFTALMTYCSSMSSKDSVRKVMGWYIATTILGGFSSRLFAGLIADAIGWQWIFGFTATLLALSLLLLRYIAADAILSFARLDRRSITRVLRTPLFAHGYLALFFIFFVFSGMLNLLPFRLTEISPGISAFDISLFYLGYLIGMPIAIYNEKIISFFGGAGRALCWGLGLNVIGLVAYLTTEIHFIWFMMLSFSAGMFFIHATLSGLVNYYAKEHKGVVNGLYVSIYYASGALGSWLPSVFYQRYSWEALIYTLVGMTLLGVFFVTRMTRATRTLEECLSDWQ